MIANILTFGTLTLDSINLSGQVAATKVTTSGIFTGGVCPSRINCVPEPLKAVVTARSHKSSSRQAGKPAREFLQEVCDRGTSSELQVLKTKVFYLQSESHLRMN